MTTAALRRPSLARPFRALADGIADFFGMVARMHALRRIYETSEAELAARGTTREAEARRIVGVSAHI